MSWLARKKTMQAETPDRQWKKMRWLMQNCLMKDMFVFVAREYVEDTQNGTGESASLSTWSKKSIAFKAISRFSSLGKKAQLWIYRSIQKDLVSSTCTQPVVLAPPKSSHRISHKQWPKPCLFVVYRRSFRGYITNTMNSGSRNLDQSGFHHPYHSPVLLPLLTRWKWP